MCVSVCGFISAFHQKLYSAPSKSIKAQFGSAAFERPPPPSSSGQAHRRCSSGEPAARGNRCRRSDILRSMRSQQERRPVVRRAQVVSSDPQAPARATHAQSDSGVISPIFSYRLSGRLTPPRLQSAAPRDLHLRLGHVAHFPGSRCLSNALLTELAYCLPTPRHVRPRHHAARRLHHAISEIRRFARLTRHLRRALLRSIVRVRQNSAPARRMDQSHNRGYRSPSALPARKPRRGSASRRNRRRIQHPFGTGFIRCLSGPSNRWKVSPVPPPAQPGYPVQAVPSDAVDRGVNPLSSVPPPFMPARIAPVLPRDREEADAAPFSAAASTFLSGKLLQTPEHVFFNFSRAGLALRGELRAVNQYLLHPAGRRGRRAARDAPLRIAVARASAGVVHLALPPRRSAPQHLRCTCGSATVIPRQEHLVVVAAEIDRPRCRRSCRTVTIRRRISVARAAQVAARASGPSSSGEPFRPHSRLTIATIRSCVRVVEIALAPSESSSGVWPPLRRAA